MTEPLLLRVRDIGIRYRIGRGLSFRPQRHFNAVSGVSFDLKLGETLALVGESGAGKSTVGRAVLGLTPIYAGAIEYKGSAIGDWMANRMLDFRNSVQAVFQDPSSALNRSMLVGDLVKEVLRIHQPEWDGAAVRRRTLELLEMVGLSEFHCDRYPDELSGGQKQRVAIARALAPGPDLIVCDEATSALDGSTQNQIINLLQELKSELGLSLLFISHNLAIVEHISDRVAVMQLGEMVEIGTAAQVCRSPAAEYTKSLWASVPSVRSVLA